MTALSTSDVLDRHLNSFAKRDVAAIVADYSSDAVLFTPTGPLRGPAAIKPLFEALVSEFAKPGRRSRCSTDRLRAITAIFYGQPTRRIIRMNSLLTHLSCGMGRL